MCHCHCHCATLKHAFTWRSTMWWQNTRAIIMKHDPCNHTRWKHKWSLHTRGCVWDRVASEWSEKEQWNKERKKCQTAEDKRVFRHFRPSPRCYTDQKLVKGGNQTKKGRNQDNWDFQMPQFTPHRRNHGSNVCRSQRGRQMDQRALRHGSRIQRGNWALHF